ncbi:MAG: hypothetical protein D6689_03160 [Deltaproteobacteria bacterium]|nr:MAG: hypothetical protein D6689_03160 [Deltaproteobacteria bacterium]
MDVFIDVIDHRGRYVPSRDPVWCDAGVGKVVPFACRVAARAGIAAGTNVAVYHVEESRFLAWPDFSEACVRDFDTVVVVASGDPAFEDGRVIEGTWLVTDGMARRAYHEARRRLRAYENGRRLRAATAT